MTNKKRIFMFVFCHHGTLVYYKNNNNNNTRNIPLSLPKQNIYIPLISQTLVSLFFFGATIKYLCHDLNSSSRGRKIL